VSSPPVAAVLGSYLEVQRPPLVPELALWLVAGHVNLDARCEELVAGEAPYWAFCWGAGQALARHVLDHPELVRGKTVIDFGAGSGVLAIAAARAGAAHAIAVDTDARSRSVIAANAALNGIAVTTASQVPECYELILASDVLYDAAAAQWLLDAPQRGCEVLLADPHRHGCARPAVEPIACVAATAFPDVDYPICNAYLYRLQRAAHP
jgi:predicted nicotinamide N-methyase